MSPLFVVRSRCHFNSNHNQIIIFVLSGKTMVIHSTQLPFARSFIILGRWIAHVSSVEYQLARSPRIDFTFSTILFRFHSNEIKIELIWCDARAASARFESHDSHTMPIDWSMRVNSLSPAFTILSNKLSIHATLNALYRMISPMNMNEMHGSWITILYSR